MRDEGKMGGGVQSAEYGVRSTEYVANDDCNVAPFSTNSVLRTPYLALIEIALIFAVFAIQGAWPVPDVNEPYYLGKAIHYWNPDWLRGDFFMESADSHKVFYFTFGWLSLWLTPVALAWTGRILTWGLLAWAWRRLSWAVVPRAWYAILTAALFACLMDRCHMAGEWVIGGVEAKGFGYVFVFLGLEALVRNRWNRALVLFGAAAAFHVLVGGWAAVAAGIAWLWLRLPSPFGRGAGGEGRTAGIPPLSSLWPGLLGGLLLSLPGVIPSLMLDWGVDPQTVREAHQIYVFDRLPHHLVLAGMRPELILRLGLLWGFWLVLGRWSRQRCLASLEKPSCHPERSKGPVAATQILRCAQNDDWQNDDWPLRRLRAFVTGAVVITLIGVAIQPLVYLGAASRAVAADLLRYYWFRLTDVALPLGVALEGAALMAGFVPRGACVTSTNAAPLQWRGAFWCSRRFWLVLAILLAALHVGDRAVDRIWPGPPRSHRLADFPSWYDACQWVVNSGRIPPDARFLAPRLSQTFKWYTGHGDVATGKDVPQDARGIVDWWGRIQDIYATEAGKGDRSNLCAAPFGPFRQIGPVPFSPPEPRWYDPLAVRGGEALKQLGAKYGADYLITEVTDPPPDLPVVYCNRTYVIYRLR